MSMGLAPLAGPATVNNMAGNTLASSTQVFGTSAGTWATSGLMASGAVGTVFSVSNMTEAGTGYNLAKEIMFQGDDKTYREHNQIVNSINVNTIITGGVQLAQDAIANQAQQTQVEQGKEVENTWGTTDDLMNSATTPGKAGVSPVGRAYQKHAGNPNRAGTFVGKVSGNAVENTQNRAKYLNDILSDSNSTYMVRETKAFGNVLDVRLPDGTGARWSSDGETFIGFLEKYTK